MKNFIYDSKTKIIFGKDEISKLRQELIDHKVKKLLLVYGKSSIKKLGIYDKIVEVCNTLNITLFEESGIRPNPEMESVRGGIKTCKENSVDFVLAAGGGSVIDAAKSIAFGTFFDGDVWDIYIRKSDAVKSLPLGVIITLAATGSETNGNSVISNDATSEKRSVAYPFSIPQFAIIDPQYTLSVNRHHTTAGSIDIIMHIMEQYFSNTEHTKTSDYMSLGVIQSVIENTEEINKGNDNYDVRSNISWASTIGLNWILGVDKVGDWATHRLSYALTKEYNVTHGYALAMLFTSWARIAYKYNKETMTRKLQLFGETLFGITEPLEVLDALDDLFRSWGAEVRVNVSKELSEQDIENLTDNALALGSVGTVVEINKERANEIFKLATG
jgi:alcohol dehydrogenase YqhD (iron-dependent ADH family)